MLNRFLELTNEKFQIEKRKHERDSKIMRKQASNYRQEKEKNDALSLSQGVYLKELQEVEREMEELVN